MRKSFERVFPYFPRGFCLRSIDGYLSRFLPLLASKYKSIKKTPDKQTKKNKQATEDLSSRQLNFVSHKD